MARLSLVLCTTESMDFIEFCPFNPQIALMAFCMCVFRLIHSASKNSSLPKQENFDSELVL